MLCHTCQSLFRGTLPRETQYDDTVLSLKGIHHTTASSFKESVEQECRICTTIWKQSLSRYSWPAILSSEITSDGFTTFYTRLDVAEHSGSIWFSIIGKDTDQPQNLLPSGWVSFFDLRPASSSDSSGNARRSLADTTGSLQSLNQVSRWLESAKEDFKDPSKRSSFHTTRLLKVEEKSTATIKLCVTRECQVEGPYATLSHCWGPSQPLKLLTSNLESMKQEIIIASLPRTFQHAIVDWLQEVGLMEDVYTNSICNIAASHSPDGHGGLFRKRNPHLAKALIIYPQWENVEDRQHLMVHDRDFWKERIDNAPLNKRGWVLQERLLTSRTVHFAHDQIMWENKQERACEIYPDGCNGILQEQDTSISPLLENWTPNPNHKPDSDISLSPPYLSWWNTLPALSGISKRIHQATHDDYLAGLWRRLLPAALLWEVRDPMVSTRPHPYQAPTWSWASIDAGIAGISQAQPLARRANKLLIKLLDCTVTTVDNSAFSAVTDAYLRLQGMLYPMTAAGQVYTWLENVPCAGAGLGLGGIALTSCQTFHPDTPFSTPTAVFCLPVQQETLNRDSVILTQCLVLVPTRVQ
ncbi:hypothetical protein LARI1_G001548 [Lachnellula arida]|uniref:Heterokaryon incompatibility domain-containing protein n=1 Tax=Lachnellula arida TaxID=1316785 RepID=A0A8T9BQQ9_9HELO|nr:hypothetical protein LARI1_G001548 [Lachnellula arida]